MSSRSSPSRTNLTAGTPSWSVALTRTVKRGLSTVLSSWVILSTGAWASTYTVSLLARLLPARSAVVMTTCDSPSGRSALTVYLPVASASPLALTSPTVTVTVAYGSVSPVKVAGSVLMRPSSMSVARTSVGTLVSTVKRQSFCTSRRKTLELVALNVTECSPSARSLVLMVSVSPVLGGAVRDVLAVERDGDVLELAQAADVEDERGGRVLDVRVRTRRDRRDARDAVQLPADDDREHDKPPR